MRSLSTLVTCLAISRSAVFASLLPNLHPDPRNINQIEARQDNNAESTTSSRTSFDLSLTLVQGDTATRTASVTSGAAGNSQSSGGNSTGSGSNTRITNASTRTFDARLPAGGIQMITPAPTAGSQYYKVGDYVTFVWNYTSLSVTPSAIDILASCTLNAQTYTLAMNESVSESTQAFVWDTGAMQTSLANSLCGLIVHDSAKDVNAVAQAGYLGTFNTFRFGVYQKQPYKRMTEWTCPSCSGAIAGVEMQTMKVIFGTMALCVLGSGWFIGMVSIW